MAVTQAVLALARWARLQRFKSRSRDSCRAITDRAWEESVVQGEAIQVPVPEEPLATVREPLRASVIEVMRGAWFCSDANCVLHVRVGDPQVFGAGEWAVRPDGVVTSRRLVHGRMVCDVCAGRHTPSSVSI